MSLFDAFGNAATGYTGTVHFTSSDLQGIVPANYTFTAGDAGVHTFTSAVTLKTAGNQSLTATDTNTSSITGTANTLVSAAAASTLTVAMPATATAGAAFTATVSLFDAFGNAATGYTGTVHFTTSDLQGIVPANYTFTAGDAGVHTFTSAVTLKTAGSQSLTATDTVASSITGAANTLVSAAAASTLTVAMPSTATAGAAFTATVSLFDAFGNAATGYTGTVHFATSDLQGIVPANYTFTAGDAGVHTFTSAVTLKTAGNQSLTATDTNTSSITGTANTLVSAAAASTLTVAMPATATAGAAFTATVSLFDAFGNAATGYTGTVHFTTSDLQGIVPANYTFTAGDAGVHTFTSAVTLKTAGSQSLTATDTNTSSITGAANTLVSAAAASTLTVAMPSTATAGAAFTATVSLFDAFGNAATGYTGTVHFTTSDLQGIVPANYTFTAGDAGVHTFTSAVTLKTAGSQSLTATDTVASSITGAANTLVSAAAASTLTVAMPANATAGAAFTATVSLFDAFGNAATGYTGTVHFTTSDLQGIVPANYTFTAGDAGVHTFTSGVTLKTAGSQSLTATDTVSSSITGTASTVVSAAAASTLTVAMPSTATAGAAFTATVSLFDAFGNAATGYIGTVHFTTSDPQGIVPANYTFTAGDAGVHTFASGMTLKTAGNQSLTATDTNTSSITGTANTQVGAAAASTLTVAMPANATAGAAFTATVSLFDAFGNAATGYTGTVHFTTSDLQAVLPANYTFTTLDAGLHAFSVTLKTGGSQSVTATDTVTFMTGSASVTVVAQKPYAVGTTPGTVATVTMYNPDQTVRFTVRPFGPRYNRGVRVAVGDVTGDGIEDVIAVTNGGVKAFARIIDGSNGTLLGNNLFGVTQYRGSVSVAVGDVNGDGIADIALGTSQANPRVRVYRGGDYVQIAGFAAGPAADFRGVTTVAIGDMTGDGKAELVVSALYPRGSRVVGYRGESLAPGMSPVRAFTPFVIGGRYTNGLLLALGDVNDDGHADLVFGTGGGKAPDVTVFSGQAMVTSNTRTKIASFTPAGSSPKGGVRVGVRDIDGDGVVDILTASGDLVSAFQGGSSLPAIGLPPLLFSDLIGGVWIG